MASPENRARREPRVSVPVQCPSCQSTEVIKAGKQADSGIPVMLSGSLCYSRLPSEIEVEGEDGEGMLTAREACPQCGSQWYKRNGHIHTGKQNHRCKLCGRAFVLTPENSVITEEQRILIERLLLERISLRGICRAVGVGLRWLLQFMGARFQAAPEHLHVKPPHGTPAVILQRLEAELDELWSFVGKKANRQWVWIAMDAATRQVLAFHVGDRSSQSAQALWEKIPAVYQEHAVFSTDHSAAAPRPTRPAACPCAGYRQFQRPLAVARQV
jgi:transposase-like protein